MAKVSKRLRFEIFRRDNHQCRYCGASAPDVELHVDHVVPEALGGTTEPSNLVTACEACNNGKSSIAPDAPLVDEVRQDALRWANAMRVAADTYEAELRRGDEHNETFRAAWNRWKVAATEAPLPLPTDWTDSVTRLRIAGLTDTLVLHALDIAMRRDGVLHDNRFRYFCGIAWRMVHEIQERAREVVDTKPLPNAPPAHSSGSSDDLKLHDVLCEILDEVPLDPWIYDELVTTLENRLRGWS